jgi:predicted SAM-dependent methyltransferase
MNISASTAGAGGPARLLNFGCGETTHPAWTNLDASPASPGVIAHDLRRRFPFADGTFDAVYGSHVLEHLEPAAAQKLLEDCFRILRPGGIVRIAVPDLESIVGLYVSSLQGALKGDQESEMRYDWLMLELYDQAVRKAPGGNMAVYMADKTDRKRSRFIAERIGCESVHPTANRSPGSSTASRVLRKLRNTGGSLRRTATIVCAHLFLGSRGAAAVREGLFRDGGEVHQWMYDRFSLARALGKAGFASIQKRLAGESGIPGFAGYGLEIVNGQERKPDSLYMAGRKPAPPEG